MGKLCFNVLVVAAMCWKIACSFVTHQGTSHTKILTIVKEHNFFFFFTKSLKYHKFEENLRFPLIFVNFWWFSLNFAWFSWKFGVPPPKKIYLWENYVLMCLLLPQCAEKLRAALLHTREPPTQKSWPLSKNIIFFFFLQSH